MGSRQTGEEEKESGMMRRGDLMGDEKERIRLEAAYSKMSDEELGELFADGKSLTEIARQALERELSARGVELGVGEKTEQAVGAAGENSGMPGPKERLAYSGPLVMVKRFRDLPEAFVAKSILDSAEIDSFLADENVVRIDWLYSNLVGGAKLMVRPEDFETATALLDEAANEANAAKNPD